MSDTIRDTTAHYRVITIDGPSGAGKGTVCLKLATALGYQLLDSGALYRIVGLKSAQAGLLPDPDNDAVIDSASEARIICEQDIVNLTQALHIEFLPVATSTTICRSEGKYDNDGVEDVNKMGNNLSNPSVRILVDGEEVGHQIRNETVGYYGSLVAALPKVRTALLKLQQQMAQSKGLVADGRDMGTVVFPNADVKIFLTASSEARAKRRVAQLQQAGQEADYAAILASIQARDERDETRSVSPSKPAKDALIIDSSSMSADEVFVVIKKHCQSKGICF